MVAICTYYYRVMAPDYGRRQYCVQIIRMIQSIPCPAKKIFFIIFKKQSDLIKTNREGATSAAEEKYLRIHQVGSYTRI